MGFVDKMKNFMMGEDFAESDDYGYEEEEVVENNRGFSSTEKEDPKASKSKYVNLHASSQLSVVLVKPESFAEASSIGDHLNQKRTVVLNLESANKDVSRRLVDFLSGVAYANNGTLKRVANCTYIITPYNVDVMGDELLDEFEGSGLYL